MRTIKVTGKGNLSVRPDTTRITLTLEGKYQEYKEALERSSKDTKLLGELLTGFGFERTDLKTLSFNVDTEYESYREDDVYKQRFAGYRYTHMMKIEFPSDNERLGKVLYALANSPVDPQFQISYTVKDPETVKNELLGKAVTDAKEKAAVLAQAAGLSLGEIQNIDYSWGKIDFEVRPVDRMVRANGMLGARMEKAMAYDMNIEPDDIEVSDTVTVLWEIL